MSVLRKDISDVTTEVLSELEKIQSSLSKKLKSKYYDEELLLHLIMLRTELSGIYYELDDFIDAKHIIEHKDLDEDNNLLLDSYKMRIMKKWFVFEKNDDDARFEMMKMLKKD